MFIFLITVVARGSYIYVFFGHCCYPSNINILTSLMTRAPQGTPVFIGEPKIWKIGATRKHLDKLSECAGVLNLVHDRHVAELDHVLHILRRHFYIQDCPRFFL